MVLVINAGLICFLWLLILGGRRHRVDLVPRGCLSLRLSLLAGEHGVDDVFAAGSGGVVAENMGAPSQ